MNSNLDPVVDFSLGGVNEDDSFGSVDFNDVVCFGINHIFLFLNPDEHELVVVVEFPGSPFIDFTLSDNNPCVDFMFVVKENID